MLTPAQQAAANAGSIAAANAANAKNGIIPASQAGSSTFVNPYPNGATANNSGGLTANPAPASGGGGSSTPTYNSGASGGGAPAVSSTPPQNSAPSATSTFAGVGGGTSAATVNGANTGGYNTQQTYTATDAQGNQFTYQVDAQGNVVNKQYGRSGATPDPKFAAAEAALAPGAAPTEDQFFSALQTKLQPLFDSINGAEAAAEMAANVTATKQTSAGNFDSNAQGMAGSSEANATAVAIDQNKAAAIAAAKQQQTAALQTAYSFLTSEAFSEFTAAQTRNDNLSKDYVAQMQAQAASVINTLFASGASPDSLMQSNPLEYQQILQYYQGDANAMKAAFVGAAQKSLLNNGAPVFSTGTQQVYGQMITNPDGTPGVKYTTVNLPPGIPSGYTTQVLNQPANGQAIIVSTPPGGYNPALPNGGIITQTVNSIGGGAGDPNTASVPDPTSTAITAQTGLSINAFNFLTQGTAALSRMPNSQRLEVQKEAQDWANKNGIDLSTFASSFKANNDTLASNISRFNNTKIAEGEVTGTLSNLDTASINAGLGSVNLGNVAKVLTGQNVNDPKASEYAFYFNDLKNSLSYFYAAQQGKSSPDIIDNEDAANVIVGGLSSGGISGLQSAVTATTQKMQTVLQTAVDSAQQNVWNLFGVGSNYSSSHAGGGTSGGGTSGGASTSMATAGAIYQDSQGNYWQVGADGETMTQVAAPTQ